MRQQDRGGSRALCSLFPGGYRGAAVSYAGRAVSPRRLHRQKEDCARALLRWGVSPGDPVLLCAAATPETLGLLQALRKLGAVPYLLNPTREPGELRRAIRRAGARLLLVTDVLLPRIEPALEEGPPLQTVVIPLGASLPRKARRQLPQPPEPGIEVLPFRDFLASGRMIPVAPAADLSRGDLAAVFWQGPAYDEERRLTRGELAAGIRRWEERLSRGSGPLLWMLSPWHPGALYPLLAALGLGITVRLEPEATPRALAEALLEERPAGAVITPALWNSLWAQPGMRQGELGFLKRLWLANSGEECPREEEALPPVFFPCPVEIIIV